MNPIIGIIGGKGRMGKLFASFFKERGIKVLIADRGSKLSNKEVAKKADITIVAVPIDKTEAVIKQTLPHIKQGAAIMDITSVKEMPVKAMLKGSCEVLGIHPMFGNSNPVPGQTIILCPTKKSEIWSKWIEGFFKDNNVKIEKMSAKEHDKVMSVTQGLIHFADITFIDALIKTKMPIEDISKFASKASEIKVEFAARLIDQDPGLYGNIQMANPQTVKILEKYQKSINELLKIVKKRDLPAFKKFFMHGQKSLKGFTQISFKESTFLIDQLIQKRAKVKTLKRKKPSKKDLATLGPKNTFSDQAASKHLEQTGKKNPIFYAKNIEEVFELVEKGKVQSGIIPIENILQGTVRATLDSLFECKVSITDELSLPIHHCLIVLQQSKKSDIKTIISHPQALRQCQKYLKKNFPKAELLSLTSTVAGIEKIKSANKTSMAAIGPSIGAIDPELKILNKNIEDRKGNATRFIVIEKANAKSLPSSTKTKSPKTSIIFYFSKNAPGSLFTVFQEFAKQKIDLSKIESRPTKAKFGEYLFYIDFDGHLSDPRVKKVLKVIEKKVSKLKILGSY